MKCLYVRPSLIIATSQAPLELNAHLTPLHCSASVNEDTKLAPTVRNCRCVPLCSSDRQEQRPPVASIESEQTVTDTTWQRVFTCEERMHMYFQQCKVQFNTTGGSVKETFKANLWAVPFAMPSNTSLLHMTTFFYSEKRRPCPYSRWN